MDTFRIAHASSPEWHQAANSCLGQLGSIPVEASLGFLYVTDHLTAQLPQILAFFKDQTDIQHWVGSVGIAVCATSREYHDLPAISVMIADFPPDSFRVFPTIKSDINEFSESQIWCQRADAQFAVVHGDPRNPKTPVFIAELAEAINGGFLVGGLTSSRGPSFQIAGGLTEGGVSGVVFSSRIPVATAHTQGCMPLGKKHEITECQNNIAIRIDNRPALDVFNEEVGDILARDPSRAAGYIFAGFPIKGSDTGDYIVRNLVGIDTENKLLAVGDYLNAGDTIMFCRRDIRTAYEDLIRMLHDIKRRLTRPPKGGVYYSCLGRGAHMFGENSEELKTIRQELGDIPLVGFFANGEISHNRLYGFTGVLTLFS
ncbi:MAG: FIST signal transduction protein [Sulfuricaulis sp.]